MAAPVIAVLDYGIGNLRSAEKGLQRAGADARLTADPELIAAADGVVLPGVGNFGRCMEALESTGLGPLAVEASASGRPFMGICVGMQLMFDGSDEAPQNPGLGILPGQVRRIDSLVTESVKIPQMQWNKLDVHRATPLTERLAGEWMYFVHSYAVEVAPEDANLVVATCDYGGPLAAVVERGMVWATQFHPEKSGDAGRLLLENFVDFVRVSAAQKA